MHYPVTVQPCGVVPVLKTQRFWNVVTSAVFENGIIKAIPGANGFLTMALLENFRFRAKRTCQRLNVLCNPFLC